MNWNRKSANNLLIILWRRPLRGLSLVDRFSSRTTDSILDERACKRYLEDRISGEKLCELEKSREDSSLMGKHRMT